MNGKLAFLGPKGTYTEQAAVDYGPEATLVSCPSIPAVAMAVEAGEADEGVVPIENSLGGSVTDTLDLLIHDSSLSIRHELVVQIDHCLVVNSGNRDREHPGGLLSPSGAGAVPQIPRRAAARGQSGGRTEYGGLGEGDAGEQSLRGCRCQPPGRRLERGQRPGRGYSGRSQQRNEICRAGSRRQRAHWA